MARTIERCAGELHRVHQTVTPTGNRDSGSLRSPPGRRSR
jgi:hypothetical protein